MNNTTENMANSNVQVLDAMIWVKVLIQKYVKPNNDSVL